MNQEPNILEDYDSYRQYIMEEAEVVLKEKKRFIETETISTGTKLFNLDRMIDFFYLEDEHVLTNELLNMKTAIVIKHFLKRKSLDI